ncbi:MAG TPA: DUF5522 domain-containing protein [Chitinophagaceae bacterium]|nr:DUF5522 domain-containing protein [Chitinophagaceae bacterium]
MQQWVEGVHYYINEQGLVVLTARYHMDRGYCCGNGCKHCPYEYENVPEPRKSELLKGREGESRKS